MAFESSAELPKQSKFPQDRLSSKKKIPSDIDETIQALGTAQPRLSRIPLKTKKQTKDDDHGRSDMNCKFVLSISFRLYQGQAKL